MSIKNIPLFGASSSPVVASSQPVVQVRAMRGKVVLAAGVDLHENRRKQEAAAALIAAEEARKAEDNKKKEAREAKRLVEALKQGIPVEEVKLKKGRNTGSPKAENRCSRRELEVFYNDGRSPDVSHFDSMKEARAIGLACINDDPFCRGYNIRWQEEVCLVNENGDPILDKNGNLTFSAPFPRSETKLALEVARQSQDEINKGRRVMMAREANLIGVNEKGNEFIVRNLSVPRGTEITVHTTRPGNPFFVGKAKPSRNVASRG